jgi:hypothetical protein
MASDGGQYQCLVQNPAGEDNITATLNGNISELYINVMLCLMQTMQYYCIVSPIVTEHPQPQNVTSLEGTIHLSCTVVGFPSPAITWFHNNTLENNSLSTTDAINDYTTRSTFIRSMAELNDSGAYFCKANVGGYRDLHSNTVIVLVLGEYQFPLVYISCIVHNSMTCR